MNIQTLLHEEIAKQLTELKGMDAGTEEYKMAVDNLTKLTDRAIEMEKLDIETRDKKEERVDRIIKNCLAGAGISIPTLVTIWGTLKSLKFEETGTVTTIMGRGFINKLLPKK